MRGGWAGILVLLMGCGQVDTAGTSSGSDAGTSSGGATSDAGTGTGTTSAAAQARVSVMPAGTGQGRVTSSPAGIDCPGSCIATVPAGTPMTLIAKSNDGSMFAGWGGGCSGPGVCNVVANGDLTVWVDFEPHTPPPPPMSCEGLTPPAPSTPITANFDHFNQCESGIGDAAGTIGLRSRGGDTMSSSRQRNLIIVDEATGRQKRFIGNLGSPNSDDAFLAQSIGFLDVMYAPQVLSVARYDGDGKSSAQSIPMAAAKPVAMSGYGGKGLLLAGRFNTKAIDLTVEAPQQICFFADGVKPTFCHDLPKVAVFGLGMDAKNRTLVIIPGAIAGSVDGRWFDADGTPMGTEFTITSNFEAAENTWFETAPLIGGDLAVRRVDQRHDPGSAGNTNPAGPDFRTSQWLAVVKSGSMTVTAAPQWLKSRDNSDLAIVRSGKAYAILPLGAPGASCAQKIEVLAPDGTSCGSFDAGTGSGTCRTMDLSVTHDGTPVQVLPRTDPSAFTCSWRWWPAALH